MTRGQNRAAYAETRAACYVRGMDNTEPGGEFRQRVAANMRAEVARADLPWETIARALDLSDDAIRRRRQGKYPWGLDEIETVASLMAIDPGEITSGRPR